MSSLSLYVHFPFCLQACWYCDFYTKESTNQSLYSDYLNLVLREISSTKYSTPAEIKTLYLGGGTPSLMPPYFLEKILFELEKSGYNISNIQEMTLEVNPGTLEKNKLEEFLKLGVNRLSLGVQTFSDKHLKKLGRKHTSSTTRETLHLFQHFSVNYSVDFLFGLPEQSEQEFYTDVEEFAKLKPQHISCYNLTIPQNHKQQALRPTDDRQNEWIKNLSSYLKSHDYNHYEISNFAQPGFSSLHNSSYWDFSPYWGIGVSSHSCSGLHLQNTKAEPQAKLSRFWNPSSLKAYEKKTLSNKDYEYEELEPWSLLTEACFLGLRKLQEGLCLASIKTLIPSAPMPLLENKLIKLTQKGFLIYDSGSYLLSQEGIFLSNQVFAELCFTTEDFNPN